MPSPIDFERGSKNRGTKASKKHRLTPICKDMGQPGPPMADRGEGAIRTASWRNSSVRFSPWSVSFGAV